jgi:hypothetical protein
MSGFHRIFSHAFSIHKAKLVYMSVLMYQYLLSIAVVCMVVWRLYGGRTAEVPRKSDYAVRES